MEPEPRTRFILKTRAIFGFVAWELSSSNPVVADPSNAALQHSAASSLRWDGASQPSVRPMIEARRPAVLIDRNDPWSHRDTCLVLSSVRNLAHSIATNEALLASFCRSMTISRSLLRMIAA